MRSEFQNRINPKQARNAERRQTAFSRHDRRARMSRSKGIALVFFRFGNLNVKQR